MSHKCRICRISAGKTKVLLILESFTLWKKTADCTRPKHTRKVLYSHEYYAAACSGYYPQEDDDDDEEDDVHPYDTAVDEQQTNPTQ